jgi:hypothetical protein
LNPDPSAVVLNFLMAIWFLSVLVIGAVPRRGGCYRRVATMTRNESG